MGDAFQVQHFHAREFTSGAIDADDLNLSETGDSLDLNVLETGGTIWPGKLAGTLFFPQSR
jgi:hypothetical protein